jgi:hypothetical protein
LPEAVRRRQLEERPAASLANALAELGALPLESAIVLIASLSDHLAEESRHGASEERIHAIRRVLKSQVNIFNIRDICLYAFNAMLPVSALQVTEAAGATGWPGSLKTSTL